MIQTQLSPDELVEILDNSLKKIAFEDIKNASLEGSAKLAGFILGACFIDTLAGFHAGITKEDLQKTGSGMRFKAFVKEYLPQYNEEKLYADLRCGLVHTYSEGGTYVFTHANKAGNHMDQLSNDRVLLNLEDFLSDILQAYERLIANIKTKQDAYRKAKRRYLSIGLMGVITLE